MMTDNVYAMKPIAKIHTDLPSKFGVPRQSGVAKGLMGRIVFEKTYRVVEAFKGIEAYSHLWIIWVFSEVKDQEWSPTVRPPRLGGNTRMGVFATRSPFRPNAIGLSSVKLEAVDYEAADGPVLIVSGIDMMDGTPILDIKPYLPYTDCHPEALGGFTGDIAESLLEVDCPEEYLMMFTLEQRRALLEVLSHDPRPAYQADPKRVYGMAFAGFDVRFRVMGGKLQVVEVEKIG